MKIAAIEVARQFSMIVLIAFIIERHFGRRIPSRLMRPTISKPWNEKKEKRKKKEKKRETKKKENMGAAKGKRRESIKSWSGPYENFLGYRKNSTDPMTFLHRKCQRLNRFETVDFASRRVQKSPRTLPFSLPLLPSPPFFSHPHLFPLVLSPFFALEKKFFFPRPPKNQAKNGPALIRFPRTLLEKW